VLTLRRSFAPVVAGRSVSDLRDGHSTARQPGVATPAVESLVTLQPLAARYGPLGGFARLDDPVLGPGLRHRHRAYPRRVGRDPKRLRGLRADEHLVARALERATGGTAHAHDVDGRQGAVDLVLTHADGRTAAVEVTTHSGDEVRRRESERPGGARAWPDPRRPWWTVTGHPVPTTTSLGGLPPAVTALLRVPTVARRAAKAAAAPGADERHLVIQIGRGGLPERLYTALTVPGTPPPTADPDVPDGLTHLWLTTGWGGSPLLCWERGGGWRVHEVSP
jgi:hypothetical protein